MGDNPQNKIAKWDLFGEGITEGIKPTITKSLASYIAGSSTLTALGLEGNELGVEGAKVLAPAIAASSTLTSIDLSSNELCGLDFAGRGTYDATGINAIADALRVSSALN